MRVLLDGRMALRGLGISTFTSRLLDALATSHPDVELILWKAPQRWGTRAKLSTLNRSGLFDVAPHLDPRVPRFDVVHYLSNTGALFPGNHSLLTVHDLLYRKSSRPRDRLVGYFLEQSLSRVRTVVAVSQRTANELQLFFPKLANRVIVITHGMRRVELPPYPRTHVLAFGGGSDPRKRIDLMLAVYAEYRRTTSGALPLVVLSRAGFLRRHISILEQVHGTQVDSASDDDVTRLLASAGAVLYTSRAEGFGLPIVEAAEVGTPVVLDGSADIATEAVGKHCFLVKEPELSSWVATLRGAIAAAPIHNPLALPDWHQVAGQYVEQYKLLA